MNAPLGKTSATSPRTASTRWAAIPASVAEAGNLLLDPPMAQSTQCVKMWMSAVLANINATVPPSAKISLAPTSAAALQVG